MRAQGKQPRTVTIRWQDGAMKRAMVEPIIDDDYFAPSRVTADELLAFWMSRPPLPDVQETPNVPRGDR